MPAVVAENLTKVFVVSKKAPGLKGTLRHLLAREYVHVEAVRGVSFTLHQGEIVGFLGPNGAGKTTTLKMLAGLLYPSAGRAEVLGFVPHERKRAFLERIALVMGNKTQLVWDLAVWDSIVLQAAAFGLPDALARERATRLARMLKIEALLSRPVRKLSLGERMKAEILVGLLHFPQVLFLDEPTLGLDVTSQKAIRDFVRAYRDETGASVLLTSHYMADIEALAERVLVIHEGRLVYDGGLSGLVTKAAPEKALLLKFREPVAKERLEGLGKVVAWTPLEARLLVLRERVLEAVSRALATLPVRDLAVEEPGLEEVIRRLFAGLQNGVESPRHEA